MDIQNTSFENFITHDSTPPENNIYTYYPSLYTISEDIKSSFYYLTYFRKCFISNLYYYKFDNLTDYCLIYTAQGEGIVRYKEQDYALPPGSFLFTEGKYLEHIHAKEMRTWNFYLILLNGKNLTSLYHLTAKEGLCISFSSKFSNMPTLLKKIEQYATPSTLQEAAILSKYITDFLTEQFIEISISKDKTEVIPNYILKVKELFDTSYAQPLTLDSIAKQFHRSKYKLSRDFTKYMNTSPIEYLICRRIQIAKELLCETDEMIHDIGNSIGMENTNHFISTFKKKTGFTPLTYRNMHQNNKLRD